MTIPKAGEGQPGVAGALAEALPGTAASCTTGLFLAQLGHTFRRYLNEKPNTSYKTGDE